jgi:hypothetical protein
MPLEDDIDSDEFSEITKDLKISRPEAAGTDVNFFFFFSAC